MLPKYHFIFGLIFVFLLHLFFPALNFFSLSLIFLSSFLIDADHYLFYIMKEKDLSFIRACRWFIVRMKRLCSIPKEQRKKFHTGFFIFHGIEPIIILFLLGLYVNPVFFFIFVGFAFHMILDIPDEIIKKGTIHKISLIYSYLAYKKLILKK